jgi:geranylgeranyl reductase family protein
MKRKRPTGKGQPVVYDAVVVGAGPAGSCTARWLAEAGATVALVDAARFPRKKPCAGWINEKAVRAFPLLDAARRKVKAAGFKRLVFHSPDMAQTAQFACRKQVGYIVRREVFDTVLMKSAQAAGAEVFLGSRVAAIEPGELAMTAVLANGRRLAGRILVGADGTHSTVARLTGLRQNWTPEQLVVCLSRIIPLTARQRAACYKGEEIHVSPGFGMAPGYAWAFPGAEHVSVGIGVRGGETAALRPLFDAWVAGLRKT